MTQWDDLDQVPPWEQPGAVRRDCEPHRGEMLLRLSHLGVLLGGLSLVLIPLGVISLPFAVTVWMLARRDLARMRAGQVDPRGKKEMNLARHNAVEAVVLCLFPLLFAILTGLVGMLVGAW